MHDFESRTRRYGEAPDFERSQLSDVVGRAAVTPWLSSVGGEEPCLGVAIALEAMWMLEEGVATAEDIDTAMELGYRHPVGPRTTDVVGLDVAWRSPNTWLVR